MEPLIIICITLLLMLTLYWTHGLVSKYITTKANTYKDMEVLLSKAIECVLAVTDKVYAPPPVQPEINEVTVKNLIELTSIVKELVDRVAVLESSQKEIQGNVSSIQVAKAFIPRRRDQG